MGVLHFCGERNVCRRRRVIVVFGLVAFLAMAARSQDGPGDDELENPRPLYWPDDKPVNAGTPPALMFGRNLLMNGNAELALRENDPGAVSFWSPPGQVVAARYGTRAGEPDAASPGPPDRGQRYLRCAVFGGRAWSGNAIGQSVDVVAVAAFIDAGEVRCRVAGWFGGLRGGDASLKLIFRDASGNELGTLRTDSAPEPGRGRVARLTGRVNLGLVPWGTRRIDAIVQFHSQGPESTEAVAFADDLSLTLLK
jgi:hypothetical protein